MENNFASFMLAASVGILLGGLIILALWIVAVNLDVWITSFNRWRRK